MVLETIRHKIIPGTGTVLPHEKICLKQPVLWIRIRMDPELFVGSGSGTQGFRSGSGSESKTGWKNA
jgi:hypothetical protein